MRIRSTISEKVRSCDWLQGINVKRLDISKRGGRFSKKEGEKKKVMHRSDPIKMCIISYIVEMIEVFMGISPSRIWRHLTINYITNQKRV